MAKNALFSGVPNTLSCTYGGATGLTITDVIGFSDRVTGEPFVNHSDDSTWGLQGGARRLDVELEITTYDQTAAKALAGGAVTLQGLIAVFAGRGSAEGTTKTLDVVEGVITEVSSSGQDGNEPMQSVIRFKGTSADGTTNPRTVTIA